MQVFYHGTNVAAAESIETTGFRVGTWFALYIEDAICCGGPVVFTVNLDEREISALAHPELVEEQDRPFWQFHTNVPIGPEAIVRKQVLALSPLAAVGLQVI